MCKLYSIKSTCFGLGLLFISIFGKTNSQFSFGNGDASTPLHIEILEKFKVISKDIVYLDYQKEDAFLVNWLRGSDFDLENAKRRLLKSMEWRKQNKIDSLHQNPEIQKMKKQFKFSVENVDKEGRPILEYNAGRWDLRRITLGGRTKEILLYWAYLYEMGAEKARNLTASTGKNVTQFIQLIDINGFTGRTHACLSCLGVIGGVVQTVENNYSGFIHAFIMANVPRGFDIILDFTKALMSPATRKALVVLPRDSNESRNYFSKTIDDDQLGKEFGGKRNTYG